MNMHFNWSVTEWTFMISGLMGILLGVIYIIYGILTTKKSDLLIEKFAKQFGYRHSEMFIGKAGGIFLWAMKEHVFLNALCFPSSSRTKKIMTVEERDFIRGLPKKETRFIKIKYTMVFLGFFCMSIASLILFIFIKR